MTDYVKTNNFATFGTNNDIILGSHFETEFGAIETASATKADKISPVFSGTVTLPNVTITGTVTGTINGGTY